VIGLRKSEFSIRRNGGRQADLSIHMDVFIGYSLRSLAELRMKELDI
jgi:hypothetical protein